jgi:hypothetical protein
VPTPRDAPGIWLDAAEAEAELRDRHWWPLAAHATRDGADEAAAAS